LRKGDKGVKKMKNKKYFFALYTVVFFQIKTITEDTYSVDISKDFRDEKIFFQKKNDLIFLMGIKRKIEAQFHSFSCRKINFN